jgi:hypothetical protein
MAGSGAQGRAGADQDPRLPNKQLDKAIPYGVYDVAADTGWVNAGTDHDTAEIAVESIRRWWTNPARAATRPRTEC